MLEKYIQAKMLKMLENVRKDVRGRNTGLGIIGMNERIEDIKKG